MNFSLMAEVFPYFLEAALVTVEISALAILIGLSVGALATSAKLSRFWLLRFVGTAYVSVFSRHALPIAAFCSLFRRTADRHQS
ncbi:hypothetical protein I2750_21035 [Bacillus sp. PR5]|nr:hypothetical protein [Bacillus sp. PR5]